ncbi:TetR/AcrR family transcriptional regulator, partial [Paraconexibacter sp.]|uniref:TetR/AcrR family transcriptional regulator n=1 Tax=Paraconexibacter sp. TaxID=2949640 RepID=UPI0035686AB8
MSVLSKRPTTGQTAAVNREAILEATVQLLQRGVSYAEISVSAIAAEASVSRPTFYAYFNDKRDLMLALGARFEQRTHGAADAWLELRDDDLHATLRGVLEAFRGDHATLRAIVEAATYDPEVAEFWRSFHA